jgi:hypothetical protein
VCPAAALLQPELRPLPERAAVGLLADEPDRARAQLVGDPLQSRGRAGEVAAAEVARAARRAQGRVGDAVAELQQLELLGGLELPGREAGLVQQPPEVVARVGEVRRGCRRDAARVDAAEDGRQAGREDVGDRRRCSFMRELHCAENARCVPPLGTGRSQGRWR